MLSSNQLNFYFLEHLYIYMSVRDFLQNGVFNFERIACDSITCNTINGKLTHTLMDFETVPNLSVISSDNSVNITNTETNTFDLKNDCSKWATNIARSIVNLNNNGFINAGYLQFRDTTEKHLGQLSIYQPVGGGLGLSNNPNGPWFNGPANVSKIYDTRFNKLPAGNLSMSLNIGNDANGNNLTNINSLSCNNVYINGEKLELNQEAETFTMYAQDYSISNVSPVASWITTTGGCNILKLADYTLPTSTIYELKFLLTNFTYSINGLKKDYGASYFAFCDTTSLNSSSNTPPIWRSFKISGDFSGDNTINEQGYTYDTEPMTSISDNKPLTKISFIIWNKANLAGQIPINNFSLSGTVFYDNVIVQS